MDYFGFPGLESTDPVNLAGSETLLTKLHFGGFFLVYNAHHSLVATSVFFSVEDPDPQDPCVLGHPGSGPGYISNMYGSGSGSFDNQAKIVRKTLIPTVL